MDHCFLQAFIKKCFAPFSHVALQRFSTSYNDYPLWCVFLMLIMVIPIFISALLAILFCCDLFFVNTSYQTTLAKGASVQLVFGFEVRLFLVHLCEIVFGMSLNRFFYAQTNVLCTALESYAGRVAGSRICRTGTATRRGMRAGRARDKNSLCELLNVDSMHVKVTWAKKCYRELVVRRCRAAMPTETPYWVKNYVSIFVRAAHWMAYFQICKPKFS